MEAFDMLLFRWVYIPPPPLSTRQKSKSEFCSTIGGQNWTNTFSKTIEDKPYTKVCSYQENCKYKCENVKDIDTKDISSYKKGMKVSFNYEGKRSIGNVKDINRSNKKVLVETRRQTVEVSPSRLSIEFNNEI